jgi:20S proteasome alpha/beta subunit
MTSADDEALSVLFRVDTLGQTYAQVALAIGATRNTVSGIVKRLRDARPQAEAARLSDLQLKVILDRVLGSGVGAEEIAKVFAKAGKPMTRASVLYLIWWVMHDLAAAGDDAAQDPVAWPSWWRPAQDAGVAA